MEKGAEINPVKGIEGMLERELLKTREMMNGMPSADDQVNNVLKFPQHPQATMLEGTAQRNVPGILRQAQEKMEAMRLMEQKARRVALKEGEGMNLALSRGMMTFPMDRIASFKAIYGLGNEG